MENALRVTSGVGQLDRILGGLYIGDNVVWHDDAGSLASVFCMNFIKASQAENKPLIYVSFDRSPKNLFDQLGPLVRAPLFTIIDCFTYGKGKGSGVFLKFYEGKEEDRPCRMIPVEDPLDPGCVMDTLYSTHATMQGDVRFVFESVTGMQELWGGEEHILHFYSHSCPRLYELNTIAYWIMEKGAHSNRVRARINHIAQVAIDLSIKRGKTYLTVLKAERRALDVVNNPYLYWSRDVEINFGSEKEGLGRFDLGSRLKDLRTKRGFSQTELARLVGVTPSTISQVESNMIYPSLPALLKMAEVLWVDMSSFFRDGSTLAGRVHFSAREAVDVPFPAFVPASIQAKRLTPVDFQGKCDPYVVEIPAKEGLPDHFFRHKGEEMGYLMSGELEFSIEGRRQRMEAGDLVYLTSEVTEEWKNPGQAPARLFWVKIR